MIGVAIAQLAVYAPLSLVILFVLFSHRRVGFVGWVYLTVFCVLRIVGSALQVYADQHDGSSASSASIISSVGLSPLLLATSGIILEGRRLRSAVLAITTEWLVVLVIHVLIAAGIGILASGASALASSQSGPPSPTDWRLAKGGIIILELCWILLCIWTIYSLQSTGHVVEREEAVAAYEAGSVLLYAVLFSLVFLGIRVTDALAFLTGEIAALSPLTGDIGFVLAFDVLPEFIVAVSLAIAGLRTRDAAQLMASCGSFDHAAKRPVAA